MPSQFGLQKSAIANAAGMGGVKGPAPRAGTSPLLGGMGGMKPQMGGMAMSGGPAGYSPSLPRGGAPGYNGIGGMGGQMLGGMPPRGMGGMAGPRQGGTAVMPRGGPPDPAGMGPIMQRNPWHSPQQTGLPPGGRPMKPPPMGGMAGGAGLGGGAPRKSQFSLMR